MAVRLNAGFRNYILDNVAEIFDALDIYTGAQPANADTAASGTLLVTVTVPADGWAAASAGAAAKQGTWSGTAGATGDAGWFRLRNTGDTLRLDGNCGTVGSGADLEMSAVGIVNGGTVAVASGSLTQPAS